jgi:hypothetical protein
LVVAANAKRATRLDAKLDTESRAGRETAISGLLRLILTSFFPSLRPFLTGI